MKTILLVFAIGCSMASYAQKKLIAEVAKGYSQTGIPGPIDSSAFSYDTWQGSMNSNQFIFGFNFNDYYNPKVPMWQYDRQEVSFTTLERWDGMSYPLNNYANENKTCNSAFECVSKVVTPYNHVYDYSYTANGLIETIFVGEYQSGNIVDTFSNEFSYDNLDRLTSRLEYNSSINLYVRDSFEYNGNSLNITRFIRHTSNDDINYDQAAESIMTYSGSDVTVAEVYQDTDTDPLTPLEHKIHVQYFWQGNALDSIVLYNVNGGIVSTTPNQTIAYTYNSADYLSTIINNGEFQDIQYLTYDTDGYLIKSEVYLDNGSGTLFLHTSGEWIFDATNSIDENDVSKLTIYPNPTTEMLYLDAENIESLSIYSLSGTLIKQSFNENSISVNDLENGIYYLAAMIDNNRIVKSFVKH